MKSISTARSNQSTYWNPHQFKAGDRVICPTGEVVTIALIGIKHCADESGKSWLMKKCKPASKDMPTEVQQSLF